ncbi:hypothetical protein [Aeromonas hydrophila]|uniref:hypothetical protein n=1 Tax=Aeromonas hydrophila TaxID=644 RepID=UPI00114CDB27|nr:hypothetical protein [Aeromonas hydrophila]
MIRLTVILLSTIIFYGCSNLGIDSKTVDCVGDDNEIVIELNKVSKKPVTRLCFDRETFFKIHFPYTDKPKESFGGYKDTAVKYSDGVIDRGVLLLDPIKLKANLVSQDKLFEMQSKARRLSEELKLDEKKKLESQSRGEKQLDNHANMIQSACAFLMKDVLYQYGRTFFCETTNETANYMNAAYLSTSVSPPTRNGIPIEGFPIKFDNLYYSRAGDPLSTLNYSYNILDFDTAIAMIKSGGGVTEKQRDYLVCRYSIGEINKLINENNKSLIEKRLSSRDYEISRTHLLGTISRLEKQCPKR